MVCRWDGRAITVACALLATLFIACGLPPAEKPLNSHFLFTAGSLFLDSASTVAIKGEITFEGGKVDQSGGFQLCLSGKDTLSFNVSGPLGTQIFKMVILGDSAYLLSNREEGWVGLRRGEDISIAEFGIEHISPFLLGLFAIPQYYLSSAINQVVSDEYSFYNETIISQPQQNDREFMLIESRSLVAAVYGKRRNFAAGYYPSLIKIFKPGSEWKITLRVEKIRLNVAFPEEMWKRD